MHQEHQTVVTYGQGSVKQAWCVTPGCNWLGENVDDAGLARREGENHVRAMQPSVS
jgi:hypothetical protein